MARCPAHADQKSSLSLAEGTGGRVLLKCFAGCKPEAVVAAADLTMADLYSSSQRVGRRGRDPVAVYDYCDADGKLLYQVLRYEPKTFLQRRPGPDGGWIPNLKGVARVLYRLSALLASPPEQPVFIPEGEKDVDALVAHGLVATTNPGGACKWKPVFNDSLKGRQAVLLPDNDNPGRAHAEQVAQSLLGVAEGVRVLPLPGLPVKGDVSDWLASGGSAERLLELSAAQPQWTPGTAPEPAPEETSARHQSQADRLVHLALASGVELFRDSTAQVWARLPVGSHHEILGCRGRDFRAWLARLIWVNERKTSSPQAIATALQVLEATARFDGLTHPLFNRVAAADGTFWYDLTDDDWRAVQITPAGWKTIDMPPILFSRHAHQRPQVQPALGGSLDELLTFLNLGNPSHRLLLCVYLVACLIPDIPHPIIVLHGPQGASKTTTHRLLRRLIDPSLTETLTLPHDSKELIQQLAHNWAPFYDNISHLPEWISDVFCRTVTGDGFSKRGLYTDDEDVIYSYRRCVALNGINVAAQKADLLDRCILVELEPIRRDQRRPERQILDAFEAARPRIFGAMLDALARAMAIRPSVRLTTLPRMADFAEWGCAIAEGLGHHRDEFLAAYESNLMTRNEEVLSSNPVAASLLALMEGRSSWEGSPSALHAELQTMAEHARLDTRSKAWPKAPHIMSRRLNELRPNLELQGIKVVERARTGESGRRVSIEKCTESSDTSVRSDIPKSINESGWIATSAATSEAAAVAPLLATPMTAAPDPNPVAGDAGDATFPAPTLTVDRGEGARPVPVL